MTHEDCLNCLLANACGRLDDHTVKTKGYQEYMVELHCMRYVIRASSLGNLKYEIEDIFTEGM